MTLEEEKFVEVYHAGLCPEGRHSVKLAGGIKCNGSPFWPGKYWWKGAPPLSCVEVFSILRAWQKQYGINPMIETFEGEARSRRLQEHLKVFLEERAKWSKT